MSINHLHHVTLTVPDVEAQKIFYEDFGLIGKSDAERAILQCKGRNQDQVIVVPGHGMGLHNISFGTTTKGLSEIEKRIRRSADVTLEKQPTDAPYDGLWLRHEFDGALYNVNISQPAAGLGGPRPQKPAPRQPSNVPGD